MAVPSQPEITLSLTSNEYATLSGLVSTHHQSTITAATKSAATKLGDASYNLGPIVVVTNWGVEHSYLNVQVRLGDYVITEQHISPNNPKIGPVYFRNDFWKGNISFALTPGPIGPIHPGDTIRLNWILSSSGQAAGILATIVVSLNKTLANDLQFTIINPGGPIIPASSK